MSDKIDNYDIESEVDRMLEELEDDFTELEDFISEHKDEYSDDLADYAFRTAIQNGNRKYVDQYADDFDLNDSGDGYSTYIYETDDEDMRELLMDHGAFKSLDDYSECRFAMETMNGEILAFDEDFQREVFEKFKEENDLTDEKVIEMLTEDEGDFVNELECIGVTVKNGEISFEDKCCEDGCDLRDLLESLGWECDFEGDSWKFETLGVYFIK